MKIHLLSDLHNEFSRYEPVPTDADVVVLAGDIDLKTRGAEWARTAFDVPVIYVPGNHEYYKGNLITTREKLLASGDHRVYVLDRQSVVLQGVRFVGVTGWTNYEATGNVRLAMWEAEQKMNDFKKIRTGTTFRKTRPLDYVELAVQAERWLAAQLAEPFDGPTVVVTHHAPSLRSLSQSHVLDDLPLGAAYANRWEHLCGSAVAAWLHGHTHEAVDYTLHGTRVVSNPRGYPGEDTGFNPNLVITLSP